MLELTFKNGTHIVWGFEDDGGGPRHYRDFLDAIPADSKYRKCLEWCAGCSAIGFSLMDAGIIEEIVLMDLYKPALDRALVNADKNQLSSKVKIYNCDMIQKIPTEEKFDLVVANPPHTTNGNWIKKEGVYKDLIMRLAVDEDWKIHKEFFSNITNYLNAGADLYISEIFPHVKLIEMAKDNGLTYKKAFPAPELTKNAGPNSCVLHFKYEKEIC